MIFDDSKKTHCIGIVTKWDPGKKMSLPQCNNDSEISVFYDTQGIAYIYHRTFIARGPEFEIVTVNQNSQTVTDE